MKLGTEAATLVVTTDNFYYDPDYKVLICKKCKHAIRGLETHLEDAHGLKKKDRQPLLKHFSSLFLAKPEDVHTPPSNGPLFDALGDPISAFQCMDCNHISTNRKSMQGHCNKTHQWHYSKDDPIHWTEVHVQTFFLGFHQRYFVVRKESTPTQSQIVLTEEDQDDKAQLLQEFEESRERDAERQAVVEKEMEKSDNTGWWNLVRWRDHFAECNIKRIAHASRIPDRRDELLKHAASIVDLMIKGAVAGLSSLHDDTPFWLRTANATNTVQNRPMVRLQNEESLDRYVGYWRRFMLYCLRVSEAMDIEEDDVSSSDEDNRSGRSNSRVDSEPDLQFEDCRKLVKFNAEQRQRLGEMWASLQAKEDEKTQVGKMITLSISFILQSLKGFDQFDSPMVHFAAVLGIDEEGVRLRKGEECSFIMAGFLYCIRVLFVEHTLPAATRTEQTQVDIDRFLELRQKYLVVGGYCPTGFIIKWLGYGKTISMQSGNSPSVTWSRVCDRDILYFHGKPLPMSQFRSAIHDMIRDAEDILWRDLMWSEDGERFEIDLMSINDDLASVQRGESFVTRSMNQLGGKQGWMADRMMSAKKSKRLRVDKKWRMTRVREYSQRVRDFLELLLVLIHMTAGQPARGEEITPIRHRNGFLQERNIFVIDEQVMFVTRYHKSQALFGRPKVIPRFLPWRVGQLVAVFLTYVQEFKEDLDQQTNGLPRSDHLFHDKHGSWSTENLTKVLQRETAIRMELKLGTLDYRHVVISIGRKYIGPGFMRELKVHDQMEDEDTDVIESQVETVFNLQSAHQGGAAMRYGVRGDIVRSLTEESLLVFGELSDKWHVFLGLHSRRPQTSVKHSRGPSDGAQLVVSVKRSQSSVGFSSTASDVVSSQDDRQLITPSRTAYWGQPSAQEKCIGFLDMAAPPVHSEEEVLRAMQKALGTREVEYRSPEQERAVAAVLNQESPVVIVLPTGGGKSLTFMGPACLPEAGVTIVVAPFQALEKNIIGRCQEKGIDCIKWVYGESRYASIVVVSADRAASDQFITYASKLNSPERKLLRRVFIDEGHLTFTASDYRSKLNHLNHLRVLNCPMVILTATLPPVSVTDLMDAMRISNPIIIRACTARLNIRYMVQRCKQGTGIQVACEMAQRRRIGSERGIFYCWSRDLAEELGDALQASGFPDCRHYHSTSDGKDEVTEKWLKKGGFLTATGALGTGVDFPGVVYIVHVGIPYGLIDFAQESGRGGRNGEAVDSIILLDNREYQKLEKTDVAALTTDEFFMRQFIQGRECRRLALGQYLDGQASTCSELGGLQCDHCGEGLADWQHGEAKGEMELRGFERMMDEVQRHCGFCWVLKGAVEAEHQPDQCPEVRRGVNLEDSEALRDRIKVDKKCRVCWCCGVSQRICDGVEKKRPCRWGGIAAVLWLAWLQTLVVREAGFPGEGVQEYGVWLGLRAQKKVQGVVVSNGMRLLWDQSQRMGGRQHEGGIGSVGRDLIHTAARAHEASETESRAPAGKVVGDVSVRKAEVIEWLSRHCIYCEITGRYSGSENHWHRDCKKSQSMPDGCEYGLTLDWQCEMDGFRQGRCHSCKLEISECGLRDSSKVTCQYGDVILPVMYILYRRRWVDKWAQGKGYDIIGGRTELQKWLHSSSVEGRVSGMRILEGFEAYAMEFGRV